MTVRFLAFVLAASSLLAACGGAATDGGYQASGSGSCAFIVRYDGHRYSGSSVQVEPAVEGKRLGSGTIPSCNDTGSAPDESAAETVEVAELPGVSPSVAITLVGRSDVVLLREDVDFDALPAEVERLMRAPGCDPGDEPITLAGRWLGILGADGNTELDMMPPYDLELFVEDASPDGYERAYLTVRVPPELGQPLTHDDVRTSLWEPGTLSLTATCRHGRFVATDVEAQPPA